MPETMNLADEIKTALRRLLYATIVLYAITLALLVYVFVQAHDTAIDTNRTTAALCTFRADLASRVAQTSTFLVQHPKGFAGIPKATLVQSLENTERTLKSLRGLTCPPL